MFDNYHEVGLNSKLQGVMRAGLEAVPTGCHVMVISRHAPPLALARLQANGVMVVIGWHDLQLTKPEARDIVNLRQPALESASRCSQWIERVQGWVARLVLLLEWLRMEDVGAEALASFSPETIFDYFAGELLERVEPEIRIFLLKSAIPPRTSGQMTAALTGESRAERILANLHRRNLFITRHTNACKIYQYHPLLREFLLAQLEELLPQDEILLLKRQAVALLENEGRIEPAIELLRAAQDWPHLAGIIKSSAQDMVTQGRAQTLAEWINALSEEVRIADSWLAYWLGSCFMGIDLRHSLPCFEQAFTRVPSSKGRSRGSSRMVRSR